MAAMLVLWIALGAIVALGVKRVWFPYADPRVTDTAIVGALGAFLTGAVFALITGGRDWFDALGTVLAVIGAAVAAVVVRRIESRRPIDDGNRDPGIPPRPVR